MHFCARTSNLPPAFFRPRRFLAQPGRAEILFAREVLVETRLGHLGLFDDLVDPHALIAALGEEAGGGLEEALARLAHG